MKTLLLLTMLGLVTISSPAHAQESVFVEYAQPLRFAMASHMLGLRLEALDAGAGHAEDEHDSGVPGEEEPPIPLLALFAGSLAAADPALLQALEADLKEVHRLAGTEDDAALVQAVDRAHQTLVRVREVLVPNRLDAEPAFQAALIAKLANSEHGLGEGYEDAANGDVSAYLLAWLTLQRVGALWNELEAELRAASDGVERALNTLNTLLPSRRPPDTFRDPEDAEGAALDLVFALEGALGRPLLIRGFTPALDLMQRQTESACTAADEGRPRLALENALAARATYSAHLASTLATLTPAVHADLNVLWGELDFLRSGGDAARTCTALQDAITRARATFG